MLEAVSVHVKGRCCILILVPCRNPTSSLLVISMPIFDLPLICLSSFP